MRRKFTNFMYDDREKAGVNISWAAIFGGVVTFVAIFITLSFIGSAIGFGLAEPTSNDPMAGVGKGVIIWSVISFILSFIAAGFIAGMAAQRVGLVHGFLTWATTALVLVLLISYTTVSALAGLGRLVGTVASTAGEGVKTVAGGAANAVGTGFDKITENIGEVNTEELQQTIEKTLKDTDETKLQPDYLKNELAKAGDEIKEAGKQIALNPENADKIIDDTSTSLQEKAKKIGESADRDAIASAVAKNTELSEAEAKQATDNIYKGLQTVSKEAEQKINDASQALKEAKNQVDDTVREARVGAEKATNVTAKASIGAFFAMLISMILTSIFGVLGSRVGSRSDVKTEV